VFILLFVVLHKKLFIILLFTNLTFQVLLCYSQIQPEVWYFGNYAGVDFSDDIPMPLTDGMISTLEGCATICDPAGNILMYTNGQTVWAKDHSVMPNGTNLHGHTSSTQAACIVKQPGNNPFLYIFTTDYFTGSSGLKYSIVDISLNNGKGEIVEKNIPLLSPVSEKLTTIIHGNGTGIWVITHKWGTAEFFAYLIDETGIQEPIISSSGTVHSGGTYGYYNCIGYMKPSNNGDKIALAIYDMGVIELFDFNKNTGVVYNPLTFSGFSKSYGVEFSPDDSRLYVKGLYSGSIYQFNLNAGSYNDIVNSKTLIGTATAPVSSPNYISGALQLAPDGKIYVSKHNSLYLGRINYPNNLGTACNFVDDGFYLGGKNAQLGLPHTGISLFLSMDAENYCFGDSTGFFIFGANLSIIDSLSWDFGDPASGENNFSSLINPSHIFSAPGIYSVSVIIYFGLVEFELSMEIEILPAPLVDLGNDTLLCLGQSIDLTAGNGDNTYLWNNGSVDPSITVYEGGVYWVQATNQYGCTAIDSVIIDYYPMAWEELNLGGDTIICNGTSIALNAGSGYTFYQWSDGSNDSILVINTEGLYWIYVENPCGSGSDTIIIQTFPETIVDLGQDTTLCFGEYILLNPGFGFMGYVWQDGSNNVFYTASQTGLFWVQIIDENGCQASDTVKIEFVLPNPDIGNDTTICSGDSVTLFANSVFLSYLWNTGSDESYITIGSEGVIWCQVTDTMGCIGVDSLNVNVIFPPDLSLGEDIAACKGDSVWIIPHPWDDSLLLTWYDGSNDTAKIIKDEGYYWVTTSNKCGSKTDTVYISFYDLPYVNLGNDTLITLNTELILNAGSGFVSYLWNDNTTFQTLSVNQNGVFWVTVFDGYCYNIDTIRIESIDCELYIPIVFTPNMDGYNDLFFTETSEDIQNFRLDIFNKWGEEIWKTDEKNKYWDGKHNGNDAATGVYFWIARYNCANNPSEIIKKGSVTLLRGYH
jgi:gliding motility-associated-like protein